MHAQLSITARYLTFCQTVKALSRLCRNAGLQEPSLVTIVRNTRMSCVHSNNPGHNKASQSVFLCWHHNQFFFVHIKNAGFLALLSSAQRRNDTDCTKVQANRSLHYTLPMPQLKLCPNLSYALTEIFEEKRVSTFLTANNINIEI